MTDNYQTGGKERLGRLHPGVGFPVRERGRSMKA
jgi:hypothetical protein